MLICDNDNVSEYGDNSGIAGKCRYMAPEVVRHEAKPSIHTDRFSLAVVLYKMLFVEHPLEGKRTVSSIRVCVKTTKSNVMAFIRFLHGIRWTHATDLCVESIRMR